MRQPGEALVQANIKPEPPGTIFEQSFLAPRGMTIEGAAREMVIDPAHLSRFIHGTRPVDADLANRLAKFTKTSAQFWLNIQAANDLWARSKAVTA